MLLLHIVGTSRPTSLKCVAARYPPVLVTFPHRADRRQNVTLQDVEDTVRRGRTANVRDSKSGEDGLLPWVCEVRWYPMSHCRTYLRAGEHSAPASQSSSKLLLGNPRQPHLPRGLCSSKERATRTIDTPSSPDSLARILQSGASFARATGRDHRPQKRWISGNDTTNIAE